jgi:Leucine-rich repeat (LRR) protein
MYVCMHVCMDRLRSVEGLEPMTELEELYLGHNAIEDVTPIHPLRNLNTLVGR